MGTKIHGVAASELLDSSAERLLMSGLDITTFITSGVVNYEHKSDTPEKIIGKIVFAKKIMSEEECDTEDQRYFWDMTKVPYLYAIAELFDDVGHSGAMDTVAILKYNEKLFEQNKVDFKKVFPIAGWSIEGSTLQKENDGRITSSLAKKVTFTVGPCNKRAWVRIYNESQAKEKPVQKEAPNKIQDILKSMLKSEMTIEQKNLIKSEIEDMKKSESYGLLAKNTTKSGKPISSVFSAEHNQQHQFDAMDHKDAANWHYDAALSATDPKQKQEHMRATKMHMSLSQKSPWMSQRVAKNPTYNPAPQTSIGYTNIPGKNRGVAKSENQNKGFHEQKAAFHFNESKKFDKISKNPDGSVNKQALGMANHHWNEHQKHQKLALGMVKTESAGSPMSRTGMGAVQKESLNKQMMFITKSDLEKAKTVYPSRSRPFHLVRDEDHDHAFFAHFKNPDGTFDIHHFADEGGDHAKVKDIGYKTKKQVMGDAIHDHDFADYVSLPIVRAAYEYADPTAMTDLSADINPYAEPAPNHSLVTKKKPLANSDLEKAKVDQGKTKQEKQWDREERHHVRVKNGKRIGYPGLVGETPKDAQIGVHTQSPNVGGPGVSDMGYAIRNRDYYQTTNRLKNPNPNKNVRSFDAETFSEELGRFFPKQNIKRQIKPNLPKSEEGMAKSDSANSEKTIDQAIPTWDKVQKFREWIGQVMPSLSSKEASAFTRAFKAFQVKKAEKKLTEL